MRRLRINPEEVILEPRPLLFGCPGEFSATSLTLEVRIHVPVTRAHAEVLFFKVRPNSGVVVNRHSIEKEMRGHFLWMCIPENVHRVMSGQNSD